MLTLASVRAARERIRDAIYVSPCAHTSTLSERLGCELYLKLENLQMSGSFKERGARNRLVMLEGAARGKGVVAASAGNHAQGVAHHARELGIDATIVMPRSTPLGKVASTKRFGARVVLHGGGYDEAAAEARRLGDREGRTFIHPFDDELVMAGQGTLGLELLEQVPDLDAVVLPVGGGGLLAGVAVALKEQHPNVAVYGVEPEAVPSMREALGAGEPVQLPGARTLADGIAVGRVGDRPFEVARRYVDAMVTVTDEDLAEAILVLLEEEKTVAEAAGAAALAALLGGRLPVRGRRMVAVVSGGNIDVNILSRIIDRGLMKSGRMMRLRVVLRDEPGQLAWLLALLADRSANVMQIRHDRAEAGVDVTRTAVELVLETRGFEHVAEIRQALDREGLDRLE
ncbi:MAG: threonine ammonia-lyase [Myxococcota bacterium]